MQDGSFRAGITHCPIDLHTVIPKSPLAPYDALVVSLRSVTHPMHEESVAGLARQSGRPPSNFIRDVDGQGLAKGDYWVVLSAMRAWATTMSLDVLQRLREKSAQ
ncbi:hypothetical protein OU995_21595 [Roseateles sp. SL47]|uniref:hypothetical protein n=1 Tax=Roseateles sp. SL47 TaxID=2995138 RepID=UPI00226E72C6|nr:hypothetical protein [Roseateles sp. SL47]WAC72131.1 hypothetical protein OU995_21595 [Roseateles sp. SL47]